MRAAFGQPGFRLLFTGELASMIGDSLMLIVLAIWVKDLTGSNGAAGLTFFFLAAPALVAPLFGMFVDRFKRRSLLFWGNLASALAVSPLLLVHDRGDVWIVYTVAVFYGISFIVLPAGLFGLLKEMLPDEMLVDANASLATSKEALRLVGPLIGAGLFTVIGGGGVALLDAATFVLAAITIRLLKVPEVAPTREESHFRDEVLAGVRAHRPRPGPAAHDDCDRSRSAGHRLHGVGGVLHGRCFRQAGQLGRCGDLGPGGGGRSRGSFVLTHRETPR
jgi:MFS family permease